MRDEVGRGRDLAPWLRRERRRELEEGSVQTPWGFRWATKDSRPAFVVVVTAARLPLL